MAELYIRTPEGDELTLGVLGRTYPDATDFWDGNWLRVRIAIKRRNWSTGWGILLRAEEIAGLRDSVTELHRTLKGEVKMTTLEQWLTLSLRLDATGHLEVSGELRDTGSPVSHPNVLRFSLLGLDQTYLPQICGQLDDVVAAFPVRGDDPE